MLELNKPRTLGLIAAMFLSPIAPLFAEVAKQNYPVNRSPLEQSRFVALSLGDVKPAGWLRDQLIVQANGLMPAGLDKALTPHELRDLLPFLLTEDSPPPAK